MKVCVCRGGTTLKRESAPKTVVEGCPGGDGGLDSVFRSPHPFVEMYYPKYRPCMKLSSPQICCRVTCEFLSIFEENKEEIKYIWVVMKEAHQYINNLFYKAHGTITTVLDIILFYRLT